MDTNPIRRGQGKGSPSPVADKPPRSPGKLSSDTSPYPFLLPPVQPDEIGRLGNYRVLHLLSEGGMGLVFRAEDIALCRPVALKVMKPNLHQDVRGCDRFLREARVMASIKHRSLVPIYQVGQENGVVFLAMELLEGESLEDWQERIGKPEVADILKIARQVAGGLAAIHEYGLVHRDIKPANLWLEKNGQVKILDFGLARFIDDDATLTQSGAVVGTPCFMSPEQARGETVDPRSDLFSLGCVLYCLCTGASPFEARNTTAVLTALAVHDPCPVHQINTAIPRALADLISDLLEKQLQNRPASAEAVLKRLKQIEKGKKSGRKTTDPDQTVVVAQAKAGAKRRLWIVVSLAMLLVVCVGVAVPLVGWLAGHRPNRGQQASPWEQGTVYLTDQSPIAEERWPIPVPPPPGRPPMRAIGDVQVQGRNSPHGILMHPPPANEGPASLTYRLGADFKTFNAVVSMNDGPPRSNAPFTFAVYGDDKLLWKSQPLSSQAGTQTCAVSVQGVDRLKIEVQSAGDPRAAHAVWIEPRLAR